MNDVLGVWRKVIEVNGTSFESRSKQHPITYSIKLLEMYIRYREFFGDVYDFDNRISQNALYSLQAILSRKETNVKKTTAFVRLMNLLSISDKGHLVLLVFKKIFGKIIKR